MEKRDHNYVHHLTVARPVDWPKPKLCGTGGYMFPHSQKVQPERPHRATETHSLSMGCVYVAWAARWWVFAAHSSAIMCAQGWVSDPKHRQCAFGATYLHRSYGDKGLCPCSRCIPIGLNWGCLHTAPGSSSWINTQPIHGLQSSASRWMRTSSDGAGR